MVDFIKQIITIFLGSNFNIALVVDIILFCVGISIYIYTGNLKSFRIWTGIASSLLLVIVVFGFLIGYRIEFDNQDKIYILTFVIYSTSFGISFIPKSYFTKISKLILFSILSGLLFFSLDKITLLQFLSVSFSIYILSLFVCNLRKNTTHLRTIFLLLLINLFIFSFIHNSMLIIENNKIKFSQVSFIIYIIVLVFSIISLILIKDKHDNSSKTVSYFEERKNDLQRLIKLINSEEIGLIGVQSEWGDGKTHLFKLLKQEYADKYEIISISVLSIKVDNIENLLLTEIDHILEKNKIFSSTSSKLKNLFSHSFFNNFGDFFLTKESYSNLITHLVSEIKKLDKILVITFEDIDRISDKECIYKIFSISEEISNPFIKIIFQYDEKKLLSILGEKHLYLEKYIPYTITLSKIPLYQIIKILLEKETKRFNNLNIKDFEFLFTSFQIPTLNIVSIQQYKIIELPEINYEIRKVIIFLTECNKYVENIPSCDLVNFKQIIITYFYMKEFDYEAFEKFNFDQPIIDQFKISSKQKEMKINEFFKENEQDIIDGIQDKRNKLNILYILYFNCNIQSYLKSDYYSKTEEGAQEWFHNLYCEDIDYIRGQQINEKIMCLLKYLKYASESYQTRFEKIVRLLKEKVLILPEDKQCDAFNKEVPELQPGLGILPLIQAFYVYENEIDVWEKFIDFLFCYGLNNKYIDYYIIQCLSYLKIDKNELFIKIIKKFNSLEIQYGFNKFIPYHKFLKTYLLNLIILGYLNISDINNILADIKNINSNNIKPILQEFLKKLKEYRDEITIDIFVDNINTIISFIQKNIQLNDAPSEKRSSNNIQLKKNNIKEDLIKYKNDETKFNMLLYNEFNNNKINLSDVIEIKKNNME